MNEKANVGTKPRRRWERFVDEYVVDLNATQAAIRAGYSPRGASVTASKLLARAKVKAHLESLIARHREKLAVSAEKVLRELARLAFLDPRRFYNDDGTLKQVTELDPDTAACLAGMEIEKVYKHFGKGQARNTGTVTKIKFHDKGQNLERLGRHLKLFTDKIELSGDAELIQRLTAGRKRLQLEAKG